MSSCSCASQLQLAHCYLHAGSTLLSDLAASCALTHRPQTQLPSTAGSTSLSDLGASWASPLQLRVFCASGGGSSGIAYAAPSLAFKPGPAALSLAALHLDVLCYAPRAMPAEEVLAKVRRAGWGGWGLRRVVESC